MAGRTEPPAVQTSYYGSVPTLLQTSVAKSQKKREVRRAKSRLVSWSCEEERRMINAVFFFL
jgi:hypothetical protein